ncbi:alpha/beta fold hydrolase [Rugosimonospora africana]|uniref:Alpha/beta hydrolase n=1 Tax=Rugosimonospora africana TaxID=556532 RepID=A0A8J3R4W9_9ACTN|nr:alpha/beta hydrolase [Rugosimonospora africana]GIH21542.1 alpha/beta hydrolase [Rugosimonospora africana]
MTAAQVHVVENGRSGASTLLLLSNAAAPSAAWEPVVPALAEAHHVVRVDLIGHGDPPRYDVVTQARRVAEVLDRLGVSRVTAIGHSSGCMVATSLVEQRPDVVAAAALLDMGPDLEAKVPERLLFRLIKTRFPGALLWRLRDPRSMVKSARGTTRQVEIPDVWLEHLRRLTHQDFVGVMRAYTAYLAERSLPDRLRDCGLPLLVIFGIDDERWRASSAEAYRVVPGARVELLPGVGHTPPVEDPAATAKLLLEFAAIVEHRR